MKSRSVMSKTTSKKAKKKKYTTRLEKNKRIYYKNNSVIENHKKSNNKLILIVLVISLFVNAFFLLRVNNLDSSVDSLNTTIEENKKDYEKQIETLKEDYTNYLFLGDSITDYYDLDKYYEGLPVVNSGISGNTTEDILNGMKGRVYNYNPSKVFLLIGINDLGNQKSADEIVSNIKEIITNINNNKPNAEIYIESIFPINKNIDEDLIKVKDNNSVIEVNKLLEKYCDEKGYTYINIYNKLLDEDGNFSEEYTDDGLHPNEKGYEIITKELKKYLD